MISKVLRNASYLRRASVATTVLVLFIVQAGPSQVPNVTVVIEALLIIVSLDNDLEQSVLQETILAMNRTDVDSGQGRLGFDPDVFREATARNQLQTEQAVSSISDPLRRIVATAVVDKWKLDDLKQRVTTKNVTVAK
jgi:hypothetical protein